MASDDNSEAGVAEITLIKALHDKYGESEFEAEHCVIIVHGHKTENGKMRIPANLILDSAGITCPGSEDEIRNLCSNVTELDLSNNKITTWAEVLTIMHCLPLLEFLNLAKNPLDDISAELVKGQIFPEMRKLVLNFTKTTWSTLQTLLNVMPNLTELYLSGNGYTDVSMDIEPYPSLKLLQLTSNSLNQWEDIIKLDQLFPQLINIVLADNHLSTCGDTEQNERMFRNLDILNINHTRVEHWNELDKLSAFIQLKDIRLVGIPLLESFDEVKKRQMMSVYFPHVQRINGSTMSDNERDAAERIFIRHFMDNSKLTKPNRYDVLEAKHGKLPDLAQVSLAPQLTIMMTIVCGLKREEIGINTKQTVGELRKFLKPFVGKPRYRLFHELKEMGRRRLVNSQCNNRPVWTMNWDEGDILICDSTYSVVGAEPLARIGRTNEVTERQ